jgi:hypothetical protein
VRLAEIAVCERTREQAVGELAGGARAQCAVVGQADLALDLRLAHDHRLQSCGNAVQVTSGVAVAQRVDRLGQLGGSDLGSARQLAQHRGLGRHRVGRDGVDLGAVAGGDHHHLGDVAAGQQARHEVLGQRVGQGHALAHGDRGRLVRDAQGQQLAHRTTSSPSG